MASPPPGGALPRRLPPTLVLLAWAVGCGGSTPLSGQGAQASVLPLADSLYFAGEARQVLAVLEDEGEGEDPSHRHWRQIRALLYLAATAESGPERSVWLDEGVRVASQIGRSGHVTLDELYWSGVVEAHRALHAAPPLMAARMALSAHRRARTMIAVDPQHGGAHHLMGRIHAEVMMRSRAERALGRILLVGSFPRDLSWENAEAHLARAAELWPHRVQFHLDLARLMERRGRLEEAVRSGRQALATPSDDPLDERFKEEARALLLRLDG